MRGIGGEAEAAEDPLDDRCVERLILRREGVDGGRHQPDSPVIQAVPGVLTAREHERVGRFDIGPQEQLRLSGQLVCLVDPDVAPPDDLDARLLQRRDETGRLRIVKVGHIALLHEAPEGVGVGNQRPLVHAPLLSPEAATVARIAMEMVVEALGDREEVRALPQNDPPRVDPHPAHVGQHRVEQLGDTAAPCG